MNINARVNRAVILFPKRKKAKNPMTDESKKLFNAPWIVYGEPDDYSFVIQNASEDEKESEDGK